MGAIRACWTVDRDDETRLHSPSGAHVKLPYRKVGELLVALARSGAQGKPRQWLAELLWPSADVESRTVNFRRALSHLRRAIGDDGIITTSSSCRLHPEVAVRVVDEDGLAEEITSDQPSKPDPNEAFATLAGWLAENDAERFLELLCSFSEMGQDIPASRLTRMVEAALPQLSRRSRNWHWILFWRAQAAMGTHSVGEAYPHIHRATELAFTAKDPVLMREATYTCGVTEILLGKPNRALELIDRAEVAIRHSEASKTQKLDALRATAFIHSGLNSEAFAILDRGDGHVIGDSRDFASHESLRALYLATTGDVRAAAKVNELPLRFARESGLCGMRGVTSLTQAYIQVVQEPANSVQMLTDLVEFSRAREMPNIALYALEALMTACKSQNLTHDAEQAFKAATAARQKLGYRYSRWDRFRLTKLAPL